MKNQSFPCFFQSNYLHSVLTKLLSQLRCFDTVIEGHDVNKTPELTIEDYAKLDPHIVVVIDELADLMMSAAKEVEEAAQERKDAVQAEVDAADRDVKKADAAVKEAQVEVGQVRRPARLERRGEAGGPGVADVVVREL